MPEPQLAAGEGCALGSSRLAVVEQHPPGILQFWEINGTQICPTSLVSIQDFSPSNLDGVPRLRYLRLDGNLLKPPIPLDLMMCFRLLQSVVF
ncbi:hypothetical protein BTVI_36999 [Pitangus sulphuratus]|nr:hypothetical protein BTVI_36999 [Pitangus sulphuratus]